MRVKEIIPQKEIWMKQGILFPSLQRHSPLENTPVSNKNFNLLPRVSLSHSIGWEWETMETREIRDQGRLTSLTLPHQTPFLQTSTSPSTCGTQRCAAHGLSLAWRLKPTKRILRGTGSEPQLLNRRKRKPKPLRRLATFVCWNENTILLCE